ncbi:MAG TPA: winged helix-turn-helix domain-containing protein [Beijerinckiaceae bacterium]|nr:winged helix-turn-helix domain-containing protein [Beijerinckiaceae bacterium]
MQSSVPQSRMLALRERVDELEEEVRQLREQLVPPLAFPAEWRLTAVESSVLAFLFARSPHPMSKERVLAAVWGHCVDSPSEKMVDVVVSKLRVKLKDVGIVIDTHWGNGLALSPPSRALVAQSIGDRRALRMNLRSAFV